MISTAVFFLLPTVLFAQLEIAQKLTTRDGLPNIAQKLANGDSVTIAFIGGSITQGGGTNAFAVKIPDWIRAQYPSATITSVNAGVGGTPSTFGAERYDAHVLKYNPDLVFIEFAVNDGDDSICMAGMEIMVRKSWMQDPLMDVVFIYTTTYYLASNSEYYMAGYFHPAASLHEQVAKFYTIPTIGMAVDIAEAFLADTTQALVLWPDKVHPGVPGYNIYNTAITTALPTLLAAGTAEARTLKDDTLVTGLVVYESPVPHEPMPTPAPYVDGSGDTADVTYELPLPNVNWFDEPEYPIDGAGEWYLRTLYRNPYGGKFDATLGANMSQWGAAMNWVSSYFEGANRKKMFYSESRKTVFRLTPGILPIVAFVCPYTGRYMIRLTSYGGSIDYGTTPDSIAVNAVHFKSGSENAGESKAVWKCLKADMTSTTNMDLTFEVTDAAAGETFAFIGDANIGGYYGSQINDFKITVGCYSDDVAVMRSAPQTVNTSAMDYSVFPDRIFVRMNEPGAHQMKLLRADGRCCMNKTINGNETYAINRKNLSNGLYVLSILGSRVVTQSLILSK